MVSLVEAGGVTERVDYATNVEGIGMESAEAEEVEKTERFVYEVMF